MSDKSLSRVDVAASTFAEGFNCAQAVFSAYAVEAGIERETALRIAGAFGAGIASRGELCGAVSGACMAIGLKYGKVQAEDNAAREKTYGLVREFMRRFEEKHGSIVCKDLIQFDVSDPEQYQAARQANVFKNQCPNFVNDAAVILEELL